MLLASPVRGSGSLNLTLAQLTLVELVYFALEMVNRGGVLA